MKKIILISIILLACFLRFWALSSVPPSPDWDEVAYGYSAYSLLHTGRDEYGVKLPVVLRSYDDYKPALYSYLAVPSVYIFGLNTFAVRFPNAVFSVIGVIGLYFLVKKLFNDENIALLSSFLLAVSPWQIQFTRFSHEAVVAVTLNILAVYFFLSSFRKHWQIFLSALFLALTFYSYQSEKIFIPLLGIVILVAYFKNWIKIPRRYLVSAFILFCLALLPLILYISTDKNALSRAKGTSIFSHQTEVLQKSANQLILDKQTHNYIGLVINNRRFIYAEQLVMNYLSHFNPKWLFITGDLPRHHPPGMGILYLFEFPFIVMGIYFLYKRKLEKKHKLLIFSWFLIAPIPAIITYDVPHAGRTMNFLPIFQIVASLGILIFFEKIKPKLNKKTFNFAIVVLVVLFMINFSFYLNQYFNKMNKQYSSEWQYGWQQAISYLDKKTEYKKIIVSNQVPLDQSYMFSLFFLKYSPNEYQKYGSSKGFGKYEFRKIDWQKDSKLKNTLIVGSAIDIPNSAKKLNVINYLNGKTAIIIAATQK